MFNGVNDGEENYIGFIRNNFDLMKQMLPQDTRAIHILRSLAKSWKKHKEQNIPLNQAMIYTKNEFMFQQDLNIAFDIMEDPNI
jgi:hypothetical protein